jgi:hypothetical protein
MIAWTVVPLARREDADGERGTLAHHHVSDSRRSRSAMNVVPGTGGRP